ncbi:hypothetical protein GW17_00050187 [Ensete ventricosum]|nr:hypothetical protein GW17_00050187 [Ensete ventricosum]
MPVNHMYPGIRAAEPPKSTGKPPVPIVSKEIVYPCILDLDGEDERGQTSSSLAVSIRWISIAKLLQSDLATLAWREGGEYEVVAKAAAYQLRIPLIKGLREISVAVWNSNTFTADDLIGSTRLELPIICSLQIRKRGQVHHALPKCISKFCSISHLISSKIYCLQIPTREHGVTSICCIDEQHKPPAYCAPSAPPCMPPAVTAPYAPPYASPYTAGAYPGAAPYASYPPPAPAPYQTCVYPPPPPQQFYAPQSSPPPPSSYPPQPYILSTNAR